MISSLIKWDHSEDLFVTKYEQKASKSEREYTVNISDPEYEYIAGHAIDGKSKFGIYSVCLRRVYPSLQVEFYSQLPDTYILSGPPSLI